MCICMVYTIIFSYITQRNNGKLNKKLLKWLPVVEGREQGGVDKVGSWTSHSFSFGIM